MVPTPSRSSWSVPVFPSLPSRNSPVRCFPLRQYVTSPTPPPNGKSERERAYAFPWIPLVDETLVMLRASPSLTRKYGAAARTRRNGALVCRSMMVSHCLSVILCMAPSQVNPACPFRLPSVRSLPFPPFPPSRNPPPPPKKEKEKEKKNSRYSRYGGFSRRRARRPR